MRTLIIDRLIEKIEEKNNPSAVGLDTVLSYIPEDYYKKCTSFESAAKYITEFNVRIIDSVYDIVPCVKVQVACYEMYGIDGLRAFSETIKYAKEKGLIVISDVKRNDIGSTAKYYSSAYLGQTELCGGSLTPFESDFITVNGYLGTDGIKPFVEDCEKYGKGIFALVKTSNPSSGELQDKKSENGKTFYEEMGNLVADWGRGLIGKYGYSSVGAVVGATHKEQAALLRKQLKSVFFLIPGYGAQGGRAEDLAVCFDGKGRGGIVNSSRAILTAYKTEKYKGLSCNAAAREAALEMKQDLNRVLK
jgi:orotidine-5'-phosphate decarboxylase